MTSVLLFQLTVIAQDSGSPPRTGTAPVTVNIIRNQFSPQFSNPNTARNINFNLPVGTEVYTFDATDNDSDVSELRLL